MSDAECGVRGRYFSPGDIEFLYSDIRESFNKKSIQIV